VTSAYLNREDIVKKCKNLCEQEYFTLSGIVRTYVVIITAHLSDCHYVSYNRRENLEKSASVNNTDTGGGARNKNN
jgi:hypothetical protein